MRRVKSELAGLIFMVIMMGQAQADWATISAEQLEQQSDLIIVGEMVEQTKNAKEKINLGIIKITEVLKGDLKLQSISLKMPLLGEGIISSSTDVIFSVGDQGLWYLNAIDQGYYFADRPDRFIEANNMAERLKELRCKKR